MWVMLTKSSRAMLQDQDLYPEPTIFNPDRYNESGHDIGVNKDPRNIAFGFGPRIWFAAFAFDIDLLLIKS